MATKQVVILISTYPGQALGQLKVLSTAVQQGGRFQVQLFGEGGVSKEERRGLRTHGWHGGEGGADEVTAYMAESASPALLVPVGVEPHKVIKGLPAIPMEPPPPPPELKTPEPPPEPVVVPPEPSVPMRKAAFLVATHRRARLLMACLRHLSLQQVPAGWSFEILVAGQPGDPGEAVTSIFTNARFFTIPSPKVTDKLNHLAKQTNAELLLMADDDDLQSLNRLAAGVTALDSGCQWSASGVHRFVSMESGKVARWTGPPSSGFVGTTVSITRALFLKVKGYPSVPAGKDGHLAFRVNKVKGVRFFDTSKLIGDETICLQHGSNINTRPFPGRAKVRRKGIFRIRGLGPWQEAGLSVMAAESLRGLLTPSVPGKAISVALSTYNRPDSCLRLLQDIKRDAGDLGIHVTVFDDGSTANYEQVCVFLTQQGWQWVTNAVNLGKRGYWQTMNKVIRQWAKAPLTHYYFLQDDIRLCNDFFNRTIELWDKVPDRQKASLYLLRDSHRGELGSTCWTGYKSRIEGSVERTQWCDCAAFLASRHFVEGLSGRIHAIPGSRWAGNSKLSSGVGQQISTRLHKANKGLYRALDSYVLHKDAGNSLMNPRARRENPMAATCFIDRDPVTASLATIPSRRKSLAKVVARLLPQVDHLNVYLNETPALRGGDGYPNLPGFLIHPKITAIWSRDTEFGDMGDAGKFYWASEVKGWHIICDDDVLYPSDFVAILIAGSERFNRRCPVGLHGALLSEPFVRYYGSRTTFHFARHLAKDVSVHILASNSLCYHTDTIKVHRDDFKHPNMGDIWFGLIAQQQKVPLVCIRHEGGWVVDDVTTRGDSIYAHSKKKVAGSTKNTADKQTEVVRANVPWHVRAPSGRVIRTLKE